MCAWQALLLQAPLPTASPLAAPRAGIIDILQQYNTRKMAETFFKGFKVLPLLPPVLAGLPRADKPTPPLLRQYDRDQISAVNPERYAERFVRFMEEHTV